MSTNRVVIDETNESGTIVVVTKTDNVGSPIQVTVTESEPGTIVITDAEDGQPVIIEISPEQLSNTVVITQPVAAPGDVRGIASDAPGVIVVTAPGPVGPKGDTPSGFYEYTASADVRLATLELESASIQSEFISFTQSYESDSASFDNRISTLILTGAPDGTVSSSAQIEQYGFLLTSSYELDSASFDNRINDIDVDTGSLLNSVEFYSFTQSSIIDSASFDSRIDNINVDTSSLLQSTEFYTYTSSADGRLNSLETESGSIRVEFNLFTSSYTTGSFLGNLEGTSSFSLTASYSLNVPDIDLSLYLTTQSFIEYTSSSNLRFDVIEESINTTADELYAFTQSYVADSASFDNRIESLILGGVPPGTISGSTQIIELGFLDTTSFNSFTASYNTGSFQGNLDGTASFAESASYAPTPLRWIELVTGYSTEPTLVETIFTGEVYEYTYNDVIYYRFISNDGTVDEFYQDYTDGDLVEFILSKNLVIN